MFFLLLNILPTINGCIMFFVNYYALVKFIAIFFSVNFPYFLWDFSLRVYLMWVFHPPPLPLYHPPFPHISSPRLGLSCGLSSCPLVTGHIRDLVVELAKGNTVLASSFRNDALLCHSPHTSPTLGCLRLWLLLIATDSLILLLIWLWLFFILKAIIALFIAEGGMYSTNAQCHRNGKSVRHFADLLGFSR